MFTSIKPEPIKPTGTLICETWTKGNTWHFRGGLKVDIYQADGVLYGTHVFDVFVDGTFIAGWPTLDLATTCANKY